MLTKGHALYYGRAQLADEYFDRLGYQLPYRVNVADFILDLASADVSKPERCGFFVLALWRMHLGTCRWH